MKNQKELKISERLQAVFPPLSETEKKLLTESLKRDGCMNPITVWKGKDIIIDGHNRYAICRENQIHYEITEKPFANEDEAEMWMRRIGGGRRSLTAFAAIENVEKMLALCGITKVTPDTKELLKSLNPHDENVTMEKSIARAAKVSHGQVFAYNHIKDHIDEKTKGELRRGERTLGEVLKKVKTKIYHEEEEKKKNTAAVTLPANEFIEGWWNSDISLANVDDNSLDVILTDPPYPREFLDCWSKLAEFAVKKLKKGGILIAMSGQSYLPEVFKNMTVEGLDYYWTGCIYTPGTSPNLRDKRLKTNWKPYFIYTKGGYGPKDAPRTFLSSDVFVSEYKDTAEGQAYHKWGQSYPVFEELVKTFTYTTDVVCDPFLGGGTCAVACIANKRKFVGIEIDVATFNIASNRIKDVIGEIEKPKKTKK